MSLHTRNMQLLIRFMQMSHHNMSQNHQHHNATLSQLLSYLTPHHLHILQLPSAPTTSSSSSKASSHQQKQNINNNTASRATPYRTLLLTPQSLLHQISTSDPLIEKYYHILYHYHPKCRYYAFKIWFQGFYSDMLRESSSGYGQQQPMKMAHKILPRLRELLMTWMQHFQESLIGAISYVSLEEYMRRSIAPLRNLPFISTSTTKGSAVNDSSNPSVIYQVDSLCCSSGIGGPSATQIRLLRNGFVLRDVKIMGSSNTVNYERFSKRRHHIGSMTGADLENESSSFVENSDSGDAQASPKQNRLVVITWTWNFSKIATSHASLHQFLTKMTRSLAQDLGVSMVLCTNDPSAYHDAVLSCFDQYNIALLWSEQVDVELCSTCLGEQSIIETIEQVNLLAESAKNCKQDSNLNLTSPLPPTDVCAQVMHFDSTEEQHSGDVWLFDREMHPSIDPSLQNDYCFATILVLGSMEHQVKEVFSQISSQMTHLQAYVDLESAEVVVIPGGCFFEGHLISFLRRVSRQLMQEGQYQGVHEKLPESVRSLPHEERMILVKLLKLLSNVLEEEPLHFIRHFCQPSEESLTLRQWYHNLQQALELENSTNTLEFSSSSSGPIYLSKEGLVPDTTELELWNEKKHLLQSLVELLGLLFTVVMED